jgi:hypothetical protein
MPEPEEPPDPPAMPEPTGTVDREAPDPVGNRCGDPSEARVIASDQAAIDALAGCEELRGLSVWGPFDLRPLASLRRVVGEAGLNLDVTGSLAGLKGSKR